MKTTTNISRIDIIALIAVIILFAFMIPSKAETGRNKHTGLNEVQVASMQLARFNSEIEKTVEFNVPVLSENFETAVAESRLEDLFVLLAGEAKYISPSVNEDFETADAMQNLDTLNTQLEASVRYTASVN